MNPRMGCVPTESGAVPPPLLKPMTKTLSWSMKVLYRLRFWDESRWCEFSDPLRS